MSLAWHRHTGILLGMFVTLTAAIIVYAWAYGALDAGGGTYRTVRVFVLQSVLVLLTWRRLKGAAWLAQVAWCWLLVFTAVIFISTVQAFHGGSTPPAVPYLAPVVPVLAIQLTILLTPAVRQHVWKRTAIAADGAANASD